MDRWKVTIEAWPFSGIDQKDAGARSANYVIRALDASDALRVAEAIAMGVRANPAVWRAPITAVIQEQI